MKNFRPRMLMAIAIVFLFAGCEQNAHLENAPSSIEQTTAAAQVMTPESASIIASCNPNAYNIVLESRTLVGTNWEWVWSVQNLNPGNGNNGTVQNLSHWGMQFGTCFIWPNVVGAAYSFDNSTWTSFTPVYTVDPSQSCMTTPVLKFDIGTSGTAKTYYRLTLNADYPVGPAPGFYKSGSRTGCCTFTFAGVGCSDDGGPR